MINYNAANAFDDSNATCCNGPVPSTQSKPTLSDARRDDAVAYEQKILRKNQLSDEVALLLEEDDTGLMYVGDKMVVVLYIEDGIIFKVFVTNDK